MTDIVERLRADMADISFADINAVAREAADEIERLRAALQEIADNEDDELASATIARRTLDPKP
jgi:hypothetical protein